MLVHSANGFRSISDSDVEAIYVGERMGRYVTVTIVRHDGAEIVGLALVEAVEAMQRKLADALPPAA